MTVAPADPALRDLWSNTIQIRLGSVAGSGVVLRDGRIVTAAHVVRSTNWFAPVQACWPTKTIGAFATASEAGDIDCAILSLCAAAPTAGIEIMESRRQLEPGRDVWLAGFPAGWHHSTPVLSRGVVAAHVDGEIWVQGAGNKGFSGGPVVIIEGGKPLLAGVAIRLAGDPDTLPIRSVNRLLGIARRLVRQPGPADTVYDWIQHGLAAMELSSMSNFRTGFYRVTSASNVRSLLGRKMFASISAAP